MIGTGDNEEIREHPTRGRGLLRGVLLHPKPP